MSQIEYEIMGSLPDGSYKLKFTNTKFDDIIFTLGAVSFGEGEDEAKLSYEYNVIEHTKFYVKEELDKQVGDLVVQMIVTGLENNDLIYTGGTDENRNQNTEQFNL